jgi:crotonobetainyl-CoA:carnitine CoA-transferase CaiB-like acyl-CoA transferase
VPHRPMEGVRVLEVAQWTFTPAAGGVLADWGADVIKVEHAATGDAQRGMLRMGLRDTGDVVFGPIMEHPNRGKRSIGIALEDPDAREVLYDLARTSDVFLTNFLPEARRRLRIDIDDIRAHNADIVYVRGSAHGPTGPEAELGGFDSCTYWSRSGHALHVTPPGTDGLCHMPAPAYGDSIGGITIAGGIAAALFARERTGEPSEVDVSLLGVGIWASALSIDISLITGEPWEWPPVDAPYAPSNPLAGRYLTSDDRYIVFTMLQASRYWADTCRHVGREDLADDPRFATPEGLMEHTVEAAELIADAIRTRPLAEWRERLRTMAGQWSVAQDSVEAGRDEQVRAAGMIRPVVDVNGEPRELVANPVQFDTTPADLRRAPQFAEHTDELLAELGLSEERIVALKVSGAIT